MKSCDARCPVSMVANHEDRFIAVPHFSFISRKTGLRVKRKVFFYKKNVRLRKAIWLNSHSFVGRTYNIFKKIIWQIFIFEAAKFFATQKFSLSVSLSLIGLILCIAISGLNPTSDTMSPSMSCITRKLFAAPLHNTDTR